MVAPKVSALPDTVVLHIPRGGPVLSVMRVIIGGVASRRDLPLEQVDDIQLAVETLLAEEPAEGGDLDLSLAIGEGGLTVRLDGLINQSLRAALSAADPFRPHEGCVLDVRLFLDSLVDRYRVVEGEAGRFAVEMEKRAS